MKIKSIKRESYDGKVYNIGTPPAHNYFANGILVHNCYQDSTKEGKHAEWHHLSAYVKAMGEQGLFELAIGGGEPTMHPRFRDLLELCRDNGIVANFTTRSMAWFKDKKLVELVNDSVGRFAYSVDSAEQMFKISHALESAGVEKEAGYRSRLSFQYVMGTGGELQFRDVLAAARILECDLTLLGYKETGRGKSYIPRNYDYWLNIVKDNRYSYGSRIGIDTALAQQYEKELLQDDRLKTLITAREGAFSTYIDAVANKAGPSSYCKDEDYVNIEITADKFGYINQNTVSLQLRNAFGKFKQMCDIACEDRQ